MKTISKSFKNMCMIEIDKEKATKSNATRNNVYTIHTIQLHDLSKPTTTSRRGKRDRQVFYYINNKWSQ